MFASMGRALGVFASPDVFGVLLKAVLLTLVLFALGLEEVGFVTGRNLASRFRSIDALLNASPEDILQTPGVGPIMAQTIHRQLADKDMRALIARLREAGLRFEVEGPAPREGHLAGNTFVLTGTLMCVGSIAEFLWVRPTFRPTLFAAGWVTAIASFWLRRVSIRSLGKF